MSRNPHATNLRHHRQQIIADKRDEVRRKIDIDEGYERVMARFPNIMRRLADDEYLAQAARHNRPPGSSPL